MRKYCGNCGRQMAQDEKFCAVCGSRFESNVVASKEKLTDEIIKKSLTEQKSSIWKFIPAIILAILVFIMMTWKPGYVILLIPMIVIICQGLNYNDRRTNPKYFILERQCIKKSIETDDDESDVYQLWFTNNNGTKVVPIPVEKDFYDKTTVTEEFYIIFVLKEKTPCLCFRKSEWTIT